MALPAAAPPSHPMRGSAPQEFSIDCIRNACSHAYSRLNGNVITKKKLIKLVGKEMGIKGKISKEHKKMIQKQMKYVLKGKTSHLLDSEDLKNLRNACSHVFSRLDGNLTTEKKMIKLVGKEVGIKGKISKENKKIIRKQMKYVLKKKASRQQDSKDLKDDNSYIGAEASSGEVEGILTNENKHKRKRKYISNEENPLKELRKTKKGSISQEMRNNESKIRRKSVSFVDVCKGESFGGNVSVSCSSATEHSSQVEEVDASKQRVDSESIRSISADSHKNECNISLDSNMAEATSIEPLTNRSESYRSGRRRSMRLLRSRENCLHVRSDSSSTNEDGTKTNISAGRKKSGFSGVLNSNVIESADVEPLVHPRWRKSFKKLKELQLNVSYSFVFLGKCYN